MSFYLLKRIAIQMNKYPSSNNLVDLKCKKEKRGEKGGSFCQRGAPIIPSRPSASSVGPLAGSLLAWQTEGNDDKGQCMDREEEMEEHHHPWRMAQMQPLRRRRQVWLVGRKEE